MKKIAVVIPTIRPESYDHFVIAWSHLFEKHDIEFITIWDGKEPILEHGDTKMSRAEIMGDYADTIVNFNAGVRNLGFAYIARFLPDVEYIITLDDDEEPVGDPIQDHVDALKRRVPVSWISTAIDEYTRGFPYGIRDEAEVVLSHGVWQGVADWDAPSQLVNGNKPLEFYRGPVPKGIYYPMCIMNLAFKRKMLPHIYQAPWALGINRFDDIFTGIASKRVIDDMGWAAVTGYATVDHQRASNVFTNLKHEAPGIELNETYWQGNEDHEYFKIYKEKLERWHDFLNQI